MGVESFRFLQAQKSHSELRGDVPGVAGSRRASCKNLRKRKEVRVMNLPARLLTEAASDRPGTRPSSSRTGPLPMPSSTG